MILLFVGAGCSRAIDEERFPTTVEFYEKNLSNIVKELPSYSVIDNHLKTDPEKPLDIEQILWAVEEALDHFSGIFDRDKVTSQLWSACLSSSYGNRDFRIEVPNIVNELGEIRNQICRSVHSVYSTKDYRTPKYFPDFLKALVALSSPLEIFTTNYDLVIDQIIYNDKEGLKKIVDRGRKVDDREYTILDTDLWTIPSVRLDPKVGKFTKLHGSIDWKLDDDGVIQCCSVQDAGFNADLYPVLYPGFKGRPQRHPFNRFYDYLSNIASNTDIAIFIGYSFRDEEINILLRRMRMGTKIVIIDKESLPSNVPSQIGDNAEFIGTGFGSAAARECLTFLKNGNE